MRQANNSWLLREDYFYTPLKRKRKINCHKNAQKNTKEKSFEINSFRDVLCIFVADFV